MASLGTGDTMLSSNLLPHGQEVVYILKDEYRRLADTSHQYANLCEYLIRGGVDADTIALLSGTPPMPLQQSTPESRAGRSSTSETTDSGWLPQHRRPHSSETTQDPIPDCPEGYSEEHQTTKSESAVDSSSQCSSAKGGRRFEKDATRTLRLSGLPEKTRHIDITSSIRGGQLLDIYLRYRENWASVSFVHGREAAKFYDHAQVHGLYVKGREVEVSWHDRQAKLYDSVARRLSVGATRNLVIRRCRSGITEEEIRDDLDHIHSLAVVRVSRLDGTCYIGLNSVAAATFARTCMMSRTKYRGSRIDFDTDECAESLVGFYPPTYAARSMTGETAPAKTFSNTNRFQLLNFDD